MRPSGRPRTGRTVPSLGTLFPCSRYSLRQKVCRNSAISGAPEAMERRGDGSIRSSMARKLYLKERCVFSS